MYEMISPRKDQELAPMSDESYTVNECYQLQTGQQDKQCHSILQPVHDGGGSRSVGASGEVEHSNVKGDSQKGMKTCLIALAFAVILIAVVVIAALALAVINLSHFVSIFWSPASAVGFIHSGKYFPGCR